MMTTACQKELQEAQDSVYSIKATKESCAGTRATISTSTYAFTWASGDAIGMYTGSNFEEMTTKEDGASVTFTGLLGGTPQSYAVFPYELNASVEGEAVKVTMPSTYTWKEKDVRTPMLAEFTGTTSSMVFKHLGGLVQVTLKNVPAAATQFVFSTDKDITGEYTVTDNQIKSAESSSNNEVVFKFAAGTATDMDFFVPVPVGDYKISIKLLDASGSELAKKSGSSINSVGRAKYITMPALTFASGSGGGEAATTNVTIPANHSGKFYLPSTTADVDVFVNPSEDPIELVYATDGDKPANVKIDCGTNTTKNFTINLPESHVELSGHEYTTLVSKTSLSTLVIDKDTRVNTLTVSEGSVNVGGNVENVEIPQNIPAEAKIVLAPGATITKITTASPAPIIIPKENGKQAEISSIVVNEPTDEAYKNGYVAPAIELQDGATLPDNAVTGSQATNVVTVPTVSDPSASGEETQETIVEANSCASLAYAFRNGRDVKLGADFSVDSEKNGIELPEKKKLVLDLNGKTLTVGAGATTNIRVYGELTIYGTGGGKILGNNNYIYNGTDKCVINADGENAKVIVNGGDIYTVRENPVDNGHFAVGLWNGADFEMNGGKITAGWYAVAGNGQCKTEDTKIVINGGTLESVADYAMYLPQSGSTIINEGATITGGAGAICVRSGNLTVNGGTLICEGDGNTGESKDGTGLVNGTNMTANAAIRINASTDYAPLGKVEIKAGTLKSVKAPVIAADSPITITGGEFTTENYNAAIRLIGGATLDMNYNELNVPGCLVAVELPEGEEATLSKTVIDNVFYGVKSGKDTKLHLDFASFGANVTYAYNGSGSIEAKECMFMGWLSGWHQGATFSSCSFLEGKAYYPAAICYGNTTFDTCKFLKNGVNADTYDGPDEDGFYRCNYVVAACEPVESLSFVNCYFTDDNGKDSKVSVSDHPYHDKFCKEGWGDGKAVEGIVTVDGEVVSTKCSDAQSGE